MGTASEANVGPTLVGAVCFIASQPESHKRKPTTQRIYKYTMMMLRRKRANHSYIEKDHRHGNYSLGERVGFRRDRRPRAEYNLRLMRCSRCENNNFSQERAIWYMFLTSASQYRRKDTSSSSVADPSITLAVVASTSISPDAPFKSR